MPIIIHKISNNSYYFCLEFDRCETVVGSKKLAVCVYVRCCYLCVELTKLVIGGLAWFYLIQAVGSRIYIVR
jgi:hypothetical protein